MLLNNKLFKALVVIIGIAIISKIIFMVIPYSNLSNFLDGNYSIDILDRYGDILYTTSLDNGLKRNKVDILDLPDEIIKEVLNSEDNYYYFHYGVNPVSLIRALYINIKEDRTVSGASTITMQLARIITPRDKSIKSKILEMIDSVKLESRLSKKEILSLYLSYIPFGRNMEGYSSASRFYFNKELKDLTNIEIKILTLIPRSPTFYDPVINSDQVIKRLHSEISFENIKDLKLTLDKIKENNNYIKNPIKAPHFVNFVINNLDDEVYKSGLPVITTLDLDIQYWVEDTLKSYLEDTRRNRISNGAVLLLRDNQIISYIGSGDFYNNENSGQIDGVQILRQPGSTLKPYLYELAFEMGFTPATILPDIPTVFGSEEIYRPENYSQTYNGPVRVRTALASSLNIPAVYTLEKVGVKNFVEQLLDLGFDSLRGQEDYLGLGLAVGNAEVTLYELTRAFSVFRNEGILYDTIWLLNSIKDNKGKRVLDETDSFLIRDILSDNQSRIMGFGRNSVLNTDYPAYFKTGTSNQFNNIWALGATSDLTCGVWMGNFNGDTVIGSPGSSTPARIAEEILNEFSNKEPFITNAKYKEIEICKLSGGIAGKNCPFTYTEKFKTDAIIADCTFHKDNGEVKLPEEYSLWYSIYSYDIYSVDGSSDRFYINSPQEGSIYYISPDIPQSVQGVEFDILGSGSFEIWCDNKIIVSGCLPYNGIVSIGKGHKLITIKYKYGEVTRDITIN